MDSVSQDIVDGRVGLASVMSEMKPDIKIRLLVAAWPEDAPRGAVAAFCRKHKVSRSWFYKVRAQATAKGQWAALELGSTRPKTSPTAITADRVRLVLQVRAELESAGFDHGPLSVQAKLRRLGLPPPSRATLARVFNRAGVVIPEPRKRPRSAFRRFVYPAPNCCWQIDATEWTLTTGRKVVIFQLIDDHSRVAVASLVATGETSEAAIRVVELGIQRRGVPQKFLSDNGAALNPTRRGRQGQLVTYLLSLGVAPITGKPGKPTTQGKNERWHRTLHLFLNKQPPAGTIAQLQAQVDVFDEYYNTQREHQGLPPGMTPQEAWDATPTAAAPTPPEEVIIDAGTQSSQRIARTNGIVNFQHTRYQLGQHWSGHTIHILHDNTTVSFFDTQGTEIVTHPKPAHGTDYIGNNRGRGLRTTDRPRSPETPTVHEVPRHQPSTKS